VTWIQFLEAAGIGLAAGLIGGLAGIGGSLVMIPGLALVFGYHDRAHTEHHVYMAAAMVINVLVAIPATRAHLQAKAVRQDLVRGVMPAMIIAIIAGTIVSNFVDGEALKLALAAFIGGYCLLNIYRVFRPRPQENRPPELVSKPVLGSIGAAAGLAGGLLGLGGGAVMVPALNAFSRVKLRDAIAASAAIMVVSAAIGAVIKVATLSQHNRSWEEAAWLVLAMAPGALVGGYIGASLIHALPIKTVRLIVSVILLLVAIRLAL
jgi:uncharacterized membrane protein YfcA